MRIESIIQQAIVIKQQLLSNVDLLATVQQVSQACITALQNDHKLWFCGNGGSAADAQHIASELTGRFYKDRPALFAEALTVNTSYLTAVANDYGYDQVFARLVQGKGRKNDVLFGLSTSGNSPNILKAFEVAKKQGLLTIGMTGETGGKIKSLSDYLINIPSQDTPRIQECHILVGHIICQLIEEEMFTH